MIYQPDDSLRLLRLDSGQVDAQFRDGKEDAIRHSVNGDGRLFVVQKTGWGKSFCLFHYDEAAPQRGYGSCTPHQSTTDAHAQPLRTIEERPELRDPAQAADERGGHGFRKEDPNMAAIARARALQDPRNPLRMAGSKEGPGMSGRALARAPFGGGFPALPFRLQGGFTVPPWATFPGALPKIPYGGFSPVRLQASGTLQFGTKPSAGSSRSRPIPPYPRTNTAFAPPFNDASHRSMLHLCVQNCQYQHRHLSPEALAPAGLCCPGHHRLSASSASLDASASFPGTSGYRHGL